MTENNATLYARIATVTGVLAGKIRADKRHEQQTYTYISADSILQEVGNAMAEIGLSVIPGITSTEWQLVEIPNKKPFFNATVNFTMSVSDADGAQYTTVWAGMGNDYTAPDKAIYKAITSGHKYFLMKLFNIGIGNMDSEHDDSEPLETRQPLPKPASQPKQTTQTVADMPRKPSEAMLKKLWASGNAYYGDEWETKRKELVLSATKQRSDSTKHLTFDECKKLIDGIAKLADMPKEPKGDDDNTMYDGSNADGAWQSMH